MLSLKEEITDDVADIQRCLLLMGNHLEGIKDPQRYSLLLHNASCSLGLWRKELLEQLDAINKHSC